MEIIKLPFGERAPKESDCISVEELADGRYNLNTSTLGACRQEDEDSASVIGGASYDSYDAAEAAGLAIAAEQCVDIVYISTHKAG